MKSGDQEYISDDNVTTRSHIHGRASQLPIAQTTSFCYTFETDLQTSPVYSRANRKYSTLSLPSSVARTTGWSVFSGISLSEVSNLSVFALPIFVYELYNNQSYTDCSQTPLVDGKAGNFKGPDSKSSQTLKVLILGKTRAEPTSSYNILNSKRAASINPLSSRLTTFPNQVLQNLGSPRSLNNFKFCLTAHSTC